MLFKVAERVLFLIYFRVGKRSLLNLVLRRRVKFHVWRSDVAMKSRCSNVHQGSCLLITPYVGTRNELDNSSSQTNGEKFVKNALDVYDAEAGSIDEQLNDVHLVESESTSVKVKIIDFFLVVRYAALCRIYCRLKSSIVNLV